MDKQFSFNSSIKNVQNGLIAQNIRDVSNFELLRSEEAVNAVIKSYLNRFRSIGGMLTDVSKFIVNSKDVIKLKDFNDLFESIYIDLSALYSDINIISEVLSLNLERNKNYFSVMKKRVRDLWNKLNLSRSYIHDNSPSDESYFEGFFTNVNASKTKNIHINKKVGYLTLDTKKQVTHNKSYVIKSVTSTTYPEKNDNANIKHTTNPLNTFNENYKIGKQRDMLHNGLWKEEIITQEIPKLRLNISSSSKPIYRNYDGVVSIVDIEFVYPVNINRLDVDVFGDSQLTLDGLLYKSTESSNWLMSTYETIDDFSSVGSSSDFLIYGINKTGFDVLSIYNISNITVKSLRLVFNKKNYKFLDSSHLQNDINDKIMNDLSERRYDVVKFGSNIDDNDDNLATPINNDNISLYNQINTIIESTTSIQTILDKISKLLVPHVDFSSYDFNKTLKFEIGAWSIEPIEEIYKNEIGVFDSKEYRFVDKAITSASLQSKQTLNGPSTVNWYINVNNKDVPIVENGSIIRKEPIYTINLSKYSHFSSWTEGSFVLLDFPIDMTLYNSVGIYVNGSFNDDVKDKIVYLNSRLLYIKDIKDPDRADYVIRYACSVYKSVNLYSLSLKSSSESATINKIPFGVVSARKEPLESFISNVAYASNTSRTLSEDFMVANTISTIEESQDYFGSSFSDCIFIANEVSSLIDTTGEYSKYSDAINTDDTKLSSSITDANNYYDGITTDNADLSLNGTIINIAPLSLYRSI